MQSFSSRIWTQVAVSISYDDKYYTTGTSNLKILDNIITVWILRKFGLVGWVFVNGPGDRGSAPRRIIPKTQKMVLDASLLNTRDYKVRIKVK